MVALQYNQYKFATYRLGHNGKTPTYTTTPVNGNILTSDVSRSVDDLYPNPRNDACYVR